MLMEQEEGGEAVAREYTAARLLVDCLAANGADMAFCVPGESYLPVLDALHDAPSIRLITGRQEGGVAMMAEARGKLTGQPGICFVTRGPGATNASAAIHVAMQDSTPMILFIGQVGRGAADREAFQEVDYRQMFAPLAKWVAQIDDAARIPEYVGRAWHTALQGRPGPVVLALPEDMLREKVKSTPPRARRIAHAGIDQEDYSDLCTMIWDAERPFLIVGGGGWNADCARYIEQFATAHHVPVGASFRCQDYVDNASPCYAGHVGIGINPALAERIRQADLLLVLGARLGEMTTSGYSLLSIPHTGQKLVHIHSGAEEIGRVYAPDLGIIASTQLACMALATVPDAGAERRREWYEKARRDYLDHIVPTTSPGPVQMAEIIRQTGEIAGEEAILCNGAGNYAIWLHRFHRYRRYRSQLAPTSGSMGYGLPAAIAARLTHPNRPVICFAGDGCFQMTMQEFGTACQYGADIVVVVINNGAYGTIRMHQERRFPGRVSGTEIVNPDFAALARAYGGHGALVEKTEDFAPALEAALAAKVPALIEIRLPLEALTPAASLSEIRKAALAANGNA